MCSGSELMLLSCVAAPSTSCGLPLRRASPQERAPASRCAAFSATWRALRTIASQWRARARDGPSRVRSLVRRGELLLHSGRQPSPRRSLQLPVRSHRGCCATHTSKNARLASFRAPWKRRKRSGARSSKTRHHEHEHLHQLGSTTAHRALLSLLHRRRVHHRPPAHDGERAGAVAPHHGAGAIFRRHRWVRDALVLGVLVTVFDCRTLLHPRPTHAAGLQDTHPKLGFLIASAIAGGHIVIFGVLGFIARQRKVCVKMAGSSPVPSREPPLTHARASSLRLAGVPLRPGGELRGGVDRLDRLAAVAAAATSRREGNQQQELSSLRMKATRCFSTLTARCTSARCTFAGGAGRHVPHPLWHLVRGRRCQGHDRQVLQLHRAVCACRRQRGTCKGAAGGAPLYVSQADASTTRRAPLQRFCPQLSLAITYPLLLAHVQELVPWMYNQHEDVLRVGYQTTSVFCGTCVSLCLLYIVSASTRARSSWAGSRAPRDIPWAQGTLLWSAEKGGWVACAGCRCAGRTPALPHALAFPHRPQVPIAKDKEDDHMSALNLVFRLILPTAVLGIVVIVCHLWARLALSHLWVRVSHQVPRLAASVQRRQGQARCHCRAGNAGPAAAAGSARARTTSTSPWCRVAHPAAASCHTAHAGRWLT